MPSQPVGLADAISQYGPYPNDHPQTLAELVDADPDTLTHPLAWWLRKQAVTVTNRSENHYINTPVDVLGLIRNGYVIHPIDKTWRSYALTADRQPELEQRDTNRMRYRVVTTKLLPKPDDLAVLGTARTGDKKPAWLIVYAGTPDVLAKNGVEQGLSRIVATRDVVDIVFYYRDKEGTETFYSVRAGHGQVNSVDAPWPHETAAHATAIASHFSGDTVAASASLKETQ